MTPPPLFLREAQFFKLIKMNQTKAPSASKEVVG